MSTIENEFKAIGNVIVSITLTIAMTKYSYLMYINPHKMSES